MIQNGQSFPSLNIIEQRDEIEPYKIAQKFRNGEIILSDYDTYFNELYKSHKNIIDSIYGGQRYYRKVVSEYLFLPDGFIPIGSTITEINKSSYQLSETPLRVSLEDLLTAVIEEHEDLFSDNFDRPKIQWTDKNYASYFGAYYYDRNEIRINRVLNSIDIPEEVVKYVIYHECLHQYMPNHSRSFRKLEHKYPDFEKWEYFLDYKLRGFNREYSM